MNIEALKAKIDQRVAELQDRYTRRREALLEACSIDGKQGFPVQSSSGWHAPHDGWCHYETGEVYGKGQWVPLPRDDWYNDPVTMEPFPVYSHKAVIPVAQQQDLEDAAPQLEVSFGKAWAVDNVFYCYAYLRGYMPVIKVIQDFVAEEAAALREAQKALKGPAPEGRVEVTGVVRTVRPKVTLYGTFYKMTVVLPNGATVYGTRPDHMDLPGCQPDQVGAEVTFTATFERAEDDITHAFFKRPTKGGVKPL